MDLAPRRSRPTTDAVSLGDAVGVWARIAALSFGGPAAQIALMHRVLVEEKRWLGERRFLHALNYCMLLPGPEAQQLAIYIGWLMHGVRGGLIAGSLFVLPGMIAIMGLSILYATLGHVSIAAGLFFGLKAAVLVIVAQAVQRVGRRALRNGAMLAIAAGAFIALFVFRLPFPLVVLAAGGIGFVGGRMGMAGFLTAGGHGALAANSVADRDTVLGEESPNHARPTLRWSLVVCGTLLGLWLGPVLACGLGLGWGNVFSQIGLFFSKMALVTFGGAYAVLAYVAQEAVQTYEWLKPGEMLDGLGLAETTPGPLIMVNQFVGFLGAYRHACGMNPLVAGVLGGLLTTWVTFTPCFLWIFLGAPFAERLREARALNAALAAIGAAVVGVIFNLALWFGLHTLFARTVPVLGIDLPHAASLNLTAAAMTLAAAVAVFRFKLGVLPLLAAASGIGMLIYGLAPHLVGR